ncbi:MAG: sodium:calcium antiporter [Gammaproteobacteria bacterium]
MEIVVSLIMVVATTVVIARACDGFETAADYLGRHLSEGVKGASINAVGSSMPELFTTFVFLFLFADTSGFAGGIGTTAGSAIFNTLIIPAASILVALKLFKLTAIPVSKKVILRDGLMLIGAEFILIVTIGTNLHWWHGLLLILIYVGYAGILFLSMRKNPEASSTDDPETPDDETIAHSVSSRWIALFTLDLEHAIIGKRSLTTGNAWLLLSIATVFIAIACYFLVLGCEILGHALGIHGYFVAVIIAAAASSIPDTILSIKDAKKGNYDDAVSNALGSNIFDICVALGLPLLIYTLVYGSISMPVETVDNVSELRVLLLFITIAAFFIFYLGQGASKIKAYGLFGLYTVFTAFIIARAYDASWIEPIAKGLHFIQITLQNG